jgi:conjugative relaxase-like TrwC/TraI family protein
MLSIFDRKCVNELVAYHREDFADADLGRIIPNGTTWFGQAAVRLGLTGEVQRTAFRRLCRNQHPKTGGRLTLRNSCNRRVAYDCVLSAPKSVSIMASVMDDTRVIEAHRGAAAETIAEMEKVAKTRVRRKGADADRVTGNIVGTSFEHILSREGDPQLHTHNDVFNVTWDAIEAKWKALQVVEFYARSGFFTAFYRHCLAAKLHRLGYETQRTARGLEIKGVPREIIDIFSKQHAEIDRREAEQGSSGNAKLRAGIAQRCRRPKEKGAGDMDDLRCGWKDQLTPEQWEQLQRLKAAATKSVRLKRLSAACAVRTAAEHLFERQSAAADHEVLAEALMVSEGRHDLADLKLALAADQRLHRCNDFVFSRKETLAAFRLWWFVQDGIKTAPPLVATPVLSADLDAEQKQALKSLVGSRDQVMHLRGPAGSGKTTIQQELARLLKGAGKQVVMVAPTTAAVRVLKENGFTTAITLQRFLGADHRRRFADGALIILDEAGQVSVAQMDALFVAARKLHARVLLVGDTRQHTSVEAGDALRILERRTFMHRVELTTIRRQIGAPYRQVVERLCDGNTAGAFNALEKLAWVKEIANDADRYEQVAQHYLACRRSKKSALVVCATWREGQVVSEYIRQSLKKAGAIAHEERALERLSPLHLTTAQRRQIHRYEPGQVIVFRAKKDGFIPGLPLTVIRAEEKHLIVRAVHGLEVPLSPRRCAKAFSLFQPRAIQLAAGDQVLILENHRFRDPGNADLCNGDLASIARISPSGDVHLTDGRVMPAHFRHFTHGYAITSQRAQAQTVDEVLLAIDARSAFCAAKAETLYVGVSRGRERCTIFTDDKELLREAFSRSGERPGAFDLMTTAAGPSRPGRHWGRRELQRSARGPSKAARRAATPFPTRAQQPNPYTL